MLPDAVLTSLRALLPADALLTDHAALAPYAASFTGEPILPAAVALPTTTEHVSAILRFADEHRIAVVPRGAGTNLTGAVDPAENGLVLDLTRMNRILAVDPATMTATVQAGVVNADLQRAAAQVGLFYPPDPASWERCTLGGNVACDAGGPRCLKYGVTKDYVLGMTVALADGRVLRLGGPLLKNATGYQLVQLFVGSEGTLGVITELTLKLLPLPRARATAAVLFPTLETASDALTAVLAAGILPAAMELLDTVTLRAVEEWTHAGLPLEAAAMVIVEQDGSDQGAIEREILDVASICRARGALSVQHATDPAGRDQLWSARRAASEALARHGPNKLGEDVVVPRTQIPAMIRRIGQIAEEYGVEIAVFGHAGDGNLHPNILFDAAQPGMLDHVNRAAEAILRASLALGGQLSGEHGVGLAKRALLREALGDDAVDLMLALKHTFDPNGILNPGKLFPTRDGPTLRARASDTLLTG